MRSSRAAWFVFFLPFLSFGQTPVYTTSSSTQTVAQASGTTLAINSLNMTSVNADLYVGADTGAQINAADVALGSSPGTITVNTPGTISTAVTLSVNHNLFFTAPITLSATVTLSSNTQVSCAGPDALITSTLVIGSSMFLGAASSSNITLRGCTNTNTTGDNGHNTFFAALGDLTGLVMENNHCISNTLYYQPGGTTENLLFSGNSVVFSAPQSLTATVVGIYLLGATSHVRGIGNYFEGGTHGIEQYGGDGSGYPDRATIIAAGSGDATYVSNTCKNVGGACIWGSEIHSVQIVGNVADSAGDVCFDAEGSADTEMIGNTTTSCADGHYTQFYSAFGNTITGNRASSAGEAVIVTKNSDPGHPEHQQDTKISNNNVNCSTLCDAIHLEATMDATIEGNTFVNGFLDPVSNAYPGASVMGNHFTYSVSTGGVAGLSAPQPLYGFTTTISGNVITSTTAQTGYCLYSENQDYNNADIILITHNTCSGWPSDIQLAADGGNHGIPTLWRIDANFLPNLQVTVGGTNPNVGVYRRNNCAVGTCEPTIGSNQLGLGTPTPGTWEGITGITDPTEQISGAGGRPRFVMDGSGPEFHECDPAQPAATRCWRIADFGSLYFDINNDNYTSTLHTLVLNTDGSGNMGAGSIMWTATGDTSLRDLTFRHTISNGGTPTATVDTGAGTGGTVTLSASSTDSSGYATVNFGTSPVSGGVIFRLYFANSWASSPKCWLTPASTNTTNNTATAFIPPPAGAAFFEVILSDIPSAVSMSDNVWAYKCEQ